MFWKSKKHSYYVVYSYSTQDGFGIASNIIELDNKLNSEKSIKEVREVLCKELGYKDIAILNWKKLKD